ncbi:MAG TPA: hypothetical protein VG389_19655 [Myxococcota bacterium]|jgi:hypothetical protein|nr:hypothetical protein [Myxococcota bacterium]
MIRGPRRQRLAAGVVCALAVVAGLGLLALTAGVTIGLGLL